MTKKIVLAFGPDNKRIDPQFCEHPNAFIVHEYNEIWLVCSNCGATIDSNTGEIVRVISDNIPIFAEDLR